MSHEATKRCTWCSRDTPTAQAAPQRAIEEMYKYKWASQPKPKEPSEDDRGYVSPGAVPDCHSLLQGPESSAFGGHASDMGSGS
jgi:hypothetical protein